MAKPLTWDERIARADEPGFHDFGRRGFTSSDKADAASWNQCSVGEALGQADSWTDDEMERLGSRFCDQVQMNDIAGARQTHGLIRERAAQLRKGQ